jgi:hypothetical protein
MNNHTVTTFKSIRSTTPHESRPLLDILQDIGNGRWKTRVEACREDLTKKNFLPVFTPTGVFSHRSIKGLESYNGIVCLDIDGVDDPASLKEKCKEIPWASAAFITPSGRGLKVIVQTDATTEVYKTVEESVAAAFYKETGIQRDNHCKDIARIQFVSYDPDVYINESSETFQS